MSYEIKKAAVIGSGTMGGGIATLLAGVGIETVLLDIPAPGTKPGDAARKRNALVQGNIKQWKRMRPPPLFSADDASEVQVGNIEDDLDMIATADWIIEVVVERLDIKQDLMAKINAVVHPDAIITTNTSGIPIKDIAANLDESFTRRFMGTHFFNPPRYLRLLEVIPHDNTDPEAVVYMQAFGTKVLGKGVVICKDRPNFIGNRFMSMAGSFLVGYALENGFTVEEVDALTGPLIGHPKTATFNLFDLVGYDIHVFVANNLYEAIPEDPAREVLKQPKLAALDEEMLERGWLGRKSGQGFYHMRRDGGKKELWALNLETMEYEPPTKPRFESVGKHRKVEPLGERIRLLINEEDRAGQFLWHVNAFMLAYASQRVPEITDTLVNIDNAQKWGFAHEMGPFEIWDAIGVAETVPVFEEAGYPVAEWVKEMIAQSKKTFYQRDDAGEAIGYYSQQMGDYVALEKDPLEIPVESLRTKKVSVAVSANAGIPTTVTENLKHTSVGEIARNASASILDMGDGVALWEFHSLAMAIDQELVEMGYKALELLESDFDALVVGHDHDRFCVGANVFPILLAAQNDALDQADESIQALQQLTLKMRYASKPVVVAPSNMALGGGAELVMAGTNVVAHGELYAGLVEVGVGLIPAGGGCKELLRRVVSPMKAAHRNNDVLPTLQAVFETIAIAKVSASAKDAKSLGFLNSSAKIVMNRSQLLGEAKQLALNLVQNGFTPNKPEQVWAAGRDAHAALLLGIEGFLEGGYASEYDAFIARKLAYVLTGGALSTPQWVDEQYILDLERQAFLDLIMEQKTQERIAYMLENNKPLRN